MSLATRCPSCNTVFRVVQDQLRVSEGWVRCGRCAEVFNAALHLVDPSTGEPRQGPIELGARLPEPTADRDAAASGSPSDQAPPGADGAPALGQSAEMPFDVLAREAAPPGAAPAGASTERERETGRDPGTADPTAEPPAQRSTIEAAWARESAASASAAEPAAEVAVVPAAPPTPTATPTAAPASRSAARVTAPGALGKPSFVREAERAERWRRPGMRAALLTGVVLAAALLVLQSLLVFRDQSAARWPELKPLLVQLCAPLGCRVEPLRAIDALVVESSGLVRVDKSDLYRLSIALRNQRGHEVAVPAVDLKLTDTQGRLIARRVLRASELGVGAGTVRADTELALQGTLQVAAAPVAGYTIELFYP